MRRSVVVVAGLTSFAAHADEVAVSEPSSPTAAPVAAAETPAADWTFTVDSEFRYWRMADRLPDFPDRAVFNYIEQVNRFTAGVTRGRHSAWIQGDAVGLFANRYRLDGVLTVERELVGPDLYSFWPGESYANLEKLRYGYATDTTSVALGDSYVVFGRGIALNLNRNVDIDIDTSVQGVKTSVNAGPWTVSAVAGTANRQQVFQDNPNRALRPDYRHGVAGVRVERFGLGPANVGAHGVVYDFVSGPGFSGLSELGSPDAVIAGGNVEAYGVLGLDTYLEADAFLYPSEVLFPGSERRPGYAVYGSASAYWGATTWLFEGKRYRDTERVNGVVAGELYRVAVPPSLEYERVITEDSAAALGSNDILGGRVRCDWAAIPARFVPYASMAVYRDEDTEGLHFNAVPETVFHPVIGVEAPGTHFTVLANGGVRIDDRDGTDAGFDRQIHGDIDAKVGVFGPYTAAASVQAEVYQWGVNPLQQSDYVEIESSVSFLRGSDIALTWFTDYTTNPLVDSVGNLTDRLYGAAELQIKPTSAITVKAFYGAYKAGIRCSGGQCRLMPGFDGARVSVVGAF